MSLTGIRHLYKYQKSNREEIRAAWELYMGANDRWKDVQAQLNTKREIKVMFRVACYIL